MAHSLPPDTSLTGPKQLDIFVDSESVLATNALRLALAKSEAQGALSAYRTLSDLDPTHPWLPDAKALIEALQLQLPTTAQDARSVVARLDRSWSRAADALFGAGKHTILMAMWRAVAENVPASEFDPDHTHAHPSYAYSKLGAWASVEQSVLAVPLYDRYANLLSCIAEAQWHQSRRIDAIRHWCALCWLAPKRFESMMDKGRIIDRALQGHWADGLDQDFEPSPTGDWFPAWILLKEPGLARHISAPTGDSSPEAAFSTLLALTLGDSTDTRLRRKLKALHPGLLEAFLARRKP